MPPTVALTGVTGRIGSLVAARLAAEDVSLRLIARDPARVPHYPDAVAAQAEYADSAAFERAVAGAQTLLLVSAAENADRVSEHKSAVDAALAAGVTRIVYISFQGAAPDATFTFARDHWATEEHIKASGVAYTFLRDNNYLGFLPKLADPETGVIAGPAGSGRVAAVAHQDIAEVAAAVLLDESLLKGETRDLTGPEALTLDEVAQVLTQRSGRTITYQPQSHDEAIASRAHYGAPDWMVTGWVSSYEAIAGGELATTSTTVAEVTGHPPLSLRELLAAEPEALAGLYAQAGAAEVPLENPARWRKQLGQHLGHRIDVVAAPTTTTFRFDDGFATATDTETGLRLTAESASGLARIEDVVGRHLERFAHKHDITVSWQ